VGVESVRHGDARRKQAIGRLIETRMRRKELVPVELEEAGRLEHRGRPETLDPASSAVEETVHILSPFDPLIQQRRRLKLIFRLRKPLRGPWPQ
jgi:uncharacterized protein YcaQ